MMVDGYYSKPPQPRRLRKDTIGSRIDYILDYVFCKKRRLFIQNREVLLHYIANHSKALATIIAPLRNRRSVLNGQEIKVLDKILEVLEAPFKKLPLHVGSFAKIEIQHLVLRWRLENGV
jgi:hypothetical protein